MKFPEIKSEIDFSKFDDRFQNYPEPVPVELSEKEKLQKAFVSQNLLNYKPALEIPEIKGLTLKLN